MGVSKQLDLNWNKTASKTGRHCNDTAIDHVLFLEVIQEGNEIKQSRCITRD